jgi:tRNA nucleotidyltransferase/poly(A) polymerase
MKFLKRQNIVTESNKELEVPSPIWDMHEIFRKSGKKLFLVGGSVRDFLTGETPKDFDLATDATPKEMIDMFINEFGLKQKHTDKDGNDKEFDLNNGLKLNMQGAQFGVLVIYNLEGLDEGVEIATFREDLTKGRNPDVKIGATIEDDVKRRDLTINALFFDLENKTVVDLVGGSEDLENRTIRMVGDPVERIDEDKLRILRVFRFASRYESKLDDKTAEAIRNNNELNEVSPERIWEEFNKSFKQAKSFKHYLDFITEFDMWKQVFPGLNINLDDYKETDNIIFCFAQIFRDNDSNDVKSKMIKQFQSPSDIANAVAFLMDLRDFDVENVKVLAKNRERFHMSHETVAEWFKIANLNEPKHKAFVGFEPNVSSRQIMSDLGIEMDAKGRPKNKADGQKIGQEINKRTIEQFKARM